MNSETLIVTLLNFLKYKGNNWRVTAFIGNCNEKLFFNVIKGELLYLWRHSYRNSLKTITVHSP